MSEVVVVVEEVVVVMVKVVVGVVVMAKVKEYIVGGRHSNSFKL